MAGRLGDFESASDENWMNTPPSNCSTTGSRDSAQAAGRPRTIVQSCGSTPT
jgi:hypothetical protein